MKIQPYPWSPGIIMQVEEFPRDGSAPVRTYSAQYNGVTQGGFKNAAEAEQWVYAQMDGEHYHGEVRPRVSECQCAACVCDREEQQS